MKTPSLRKHVIFSRKFGHFGFCSWFGIAGSEQAFPVPLGLPMTIIVEMLQLFIFFRPCFEFPSVYSKILWFPLFLISFLFNVSKFWEYEVQVNDYCQTLGLVLRLRVDFVLPLSQQQQEEQEQPLTKNLSVGSILEG